MDACWNSFWNLKKKVTQKNWPIFLKGRSLVIMRQFSLKICKVFGWVDHPASRTNTFYLQDHYAKPWWDFCFVSIVKRRHLFLSILTHKKIKKRKGKNRKKIQNMQRWYTRRKPRRLPKFFMRNQNDRWKSQRTTIYKNCKLAT
jgi:hypothetical protein